MIKMAMMMIRMVEDDDQDGGDGDQGEDLFRRRWTIRRSIEVNARHAVIVTPQELRERHIDKRGP